MEVGGGRKSAEVGGSRRRSEVGGSRRRSVEVGEGRKSVEVGGGRWKSAEVGSRWKSAEVGGSWRMSEVGGGRRKSVEVDVSVICSVVVEVQLDCSSGYRHVESFKHDISHSKFLKFAMYSLLVLRMYSLI